MSNGAHGHAHSHSYLEPVQALLEFDSSFVWSVGFVTAS